jgi:hypothetical protein
VVCLIVLMLTVVKHPEDENGCIYDSPKTALAHQACINNLEKP